MKNLLLPLYTFLFFAISASAQSTDFSWSKGFGNNLDEKTWSSAVDKDGNIYITGSFASATVDFGSTTLTNTGSGTADAFLVKYDSTGNVIWAKSFGTINDDEGKHVALDDSGNVYFCGHFNSASITIGAFTLTNNGDDDIFVSKVDATGNVVWATGVGGANDNRPEGLIIDNSNVVTIIGGYTNAPLSFGTFTLTNAGDFDFFIGQLNASTGAQGYGVGFGGTGRDDAQALTYSKATGYLYIGGRFDSPTLGLGANTLTNDNSGTYDAFFMEFNNSQTVSWAYRFGGDMDDQVNGLLHNSNSGSNTLYVAGAFSSKHLIFDNDTLKNKNTASDDPFLVSFSSKNYDWSASDGAKGIDMGFKLAMNNNSTEICMSGVFTSTSLTIGSTTLTNSSTKSTYDLFLSAYDKSTGAAIWAKSAGDTANDFAFDLQSNGKDKLFLTGWYAAPFIKFGSLTTLPSAGGSDGFLAVLESTPTGINEVSLAGNIDVYPNPSNGQFTFKGNSLNKQSIVDVLSVKGELILSEKSNMDSFIIDMSNQPSGLYIYRITNQNEVVTGKLLKK